jgi:hypothetical protein
MKNLSTSNFAALLVVSFLGLYGCNYNKENSNKPTINIGAKAITIADTITYDVLLRPLDSTDIWEAEHLKYLNQKEFLNYVFNGLYSGKFLAYEFMSTKQFNKSEIESIEKAEGYSRDKISKVQFKELWFVDSLGMLQKHIYSYTLGIEAYSNQNTFLGHKALFEVKVEKD